MEEKRLTPIKAIRAKCLECSCGNNAEVRECVIPDCPLYPYRMGKNPYIKLSEERKAKFPQRPVPEGWEKAAGDARVLLHCFSGSAELAEQYVKLGGWISLAGPVTFKNNKKTIRVAQAVPAEFLMVETDSPFLTPEPFRGRPNMSPYVAHTARRVGVLKQMDYEEICRVTMENGKRFFVRQRSAT